MTNSASAYPPFGTHSITFLGFLYASILSGTIPLLENTTNIISALLLLLLWVYLATDWLLKYSTWKGIETVGARVDLVDGQIDLAELKRYRRTCITNFFLLFIFLLLMVVSFYIRIYKCNLFLNSIMEITLGLSLMIGWVWNIFVAWKITPENSKIRTIIWKSLTFRAQTLEEIKKYYIRVRNISWNIEIKTFGDALKLAVKSLKILLSYVPQWVLIHIFVWLTLIIKPIVGLILIFHFNLSFLIKDIENNRFNIACTYIVIQLVVDIFTVNVFHVPKENDNGAERLEKARA